MTKPVAIPGPLTLRVPDLTAVCNVDSTSFLVTWTASEDADTYRVTASGRSSGTYNGPGLETRFPCPTQGGDVTVQAVAYNDRNIGSDVARVTRGYACPMDEQDPLEPERAVEDQTPTIQAATPSPAP